ncbi:MAG TPA: HdeD family acid-resistance protein [Gemmatimonadales bacterium]|nr:HdeD family acid-resistance protein [Gemmatimonadales bacterium]
MRVPVVDLDSLTRNWWAIVLRGVAGILFGIITFFAPGISLAALVLLFGAYAFADGVLAIVTAVRRRGTDRWWLLLLEGLAGIAAGIVTLLWPGITAIALLYVIAAWALVTGAFEIAAAIRLRKVITGEWLLALSGVLSIALGVMLVLWPGPGALAVVIWIGAYALVFGVLLVALGIRLRALGSPRARQTAPRVA